MKTLALENTGVVTARERGNVMRIIAKAVFLASVVSLIGMIMWAVQVQSDRKEGPEFILKSMAGGKAHPCKIVSIDEADQGMLSVRVVAQLGDSRWQKKGMVLVIRDEGVDGLKVNNIVLLYRDQGESIMVQPVRLISGLLL